MFTIKLEPAEAFNSETNEFLLTNSHVIDLEHSLVSLSKWESIHEKPFLSKDEKSDDEIRSYVECMCLTPKIPPEVFSCIGHKNLNEIFAYVNSKSSATWFSEKERGRPSSEAVTSELIYYWMVALNIPIECEQWHLNRLFNLLKICNIKQSTQKKMSRSDIAARNRQLNQQRLAQLGTTG